MNRAMTKRLLLAAVAAIMGVATTMGQQIAVVSESGSTSVFQTLQEAIEGARDGSVVYLPGGGFAIHDSVKITKRLSIIGIGHKAHGDNADGNTTIGGNLWFDEGSSGSAVMGCYISGNITINEGSHNVMVKYCNVNDISWQKTSSGIVINQNYIRGGNYGHGGSAEFTNNITTWIYDLDSGRIENNIFTSAYCYNSYRGWHNTLYACDNCTIANNIFFNGAVGCGSNCLISGNMRANGEWGDDPINIGDADWNAVFKNYNNGAITPASNFQFTDEYKQYTGVGIYGGKGFSDGALPPVPYIVAKSIPEQTDASGKLNIRIRVNAGE